MKDCHVFKKNRGGRFPSVLREIFEVICPKAHRGKSLSHSPPGV